MQFRPQFDAWHHHTTTVHICMFAMDLVLHKLGICNFCLIQDGMTPLLLAVMYNHIDVVCYLLKNGADIFECSNVSESHSFQCIYYCYSLMFMHL